MKALRATPRKRPALVDLTDMLRLYGELCGYKGLRTTTWPVENCKRFLEENYRDGRLDRRMPFIVSTLVISPRKQFERIEQITDLFVFQYPLDAGRLAFQVINDLFFFALIVPDSIVDRIGLADEKTRKIHADLKTRLAFLETSRDCEPDEEIAALGLQEYPPHVYTAIPRRKPFKLNKESNQ